MAFPQNWSSAMANPEVPVNENFATLAHAAVFGKNPATSTGLTWGYFGGRYSGQTVADGTLTLGNNCDNYVVVNLDTGAISVSEYDVDWLDAEASVPTYGRVYLITTSGGLVSAVEDHRSGKYGITGAGGSGGGGGDQTVSLISADTYVLQASDKGKLLVFTNPAGCAVDLPYAVPDFPSGWWVDFQNISGDTVNLLATIESPQSMIDQTLEQLDLEVGEGVRLCSTGSHFFSQRGKGADPPAAKPYCIQLDIGDETTAITTGTPKYTFRMFNDFVVSEVRASLSTAQSSGSIFTVDVKQNGSSIFSTLLTVDNTEKTSVTAATQHVLSTTDLVSDDEMTVDVTQIGNGTAKGLKVYLIGYVGA